MAIILFDNASRNKLYPLTYTNAVAQLRMGIYTMQERWHLMQTEKVFVHTENYLRPLFSEIPNETHILIDASVIITNELLDRILTLQQGEALADDAGMIAGCMNLDVATFSAATALQNFENIYDQPNARRLEYPWQIFQWNDEMLRKDFALITKNRISQPLPAHVICTQPENIFIEEGATLMPCFINASGGPVYIGKNVLVMEGAMIRGAATFGENTVIKMGTKIYGAAAGPSCTLGGEIKNCVFQSHSNKAHDGYLGDAVIGNWCNLGAGTSNSNVKNSAGMVKMYSEAAAAYIEVGNKCGAVIGDYTCTAINTSLNTGTVAGAVCNLFGEGLSPNYIPNFQWGINPPLEYRLEKAIENIRNWKKFKGAELTHEEIQVLQHIFEQL